MVNEGTCNLSVGMRKIREKKPTEKLECTHVKEGCIQLFLKHKTFLVRIFSEKQNQRSV